MRSAFLGTLAVAAVAVAGCGGGGGGGGSVSSVAPQPPVTPTPTPGPTPQPPAPSPFETEYNRHGGLHLIHAAAMHERGGTGTGTVVAVIDSGRGEHPELSGKYLYESKVDIDCDPKPPGEDCSPLEVDPVDPQGHGTFVSGIVAAPRDGEGILGVAYDARLASVAISADSLSDGQFPSFLEALIPEIEMTRDLGALVTNNSWGTPVSIAVPGPSMTEEMYREFMPIDTYQAYVDAGGVQVWAVGNDQAQFPAIEPAAPFRFPDLEKGWLAVGATALDGTSLAYYSNFCGVAAAWCVVAPAGNGEGPLGNEPYDGVTSLKLGDGYRQWDGTSFSAPLVAGAIAALKSMFPNLTYHQIRDRILETADEGVYAGYPMLPPGIQNHQQIYGHGMLDLDAASRPVGSTSLPVSGSARGPVVATRHTGARLPSAVVDRFFAGRSILVLDDFQRAPFRIPAESFAERRGPQLGLDDLRPGMAVHHGARGADAAAAVFGGAGSRTGRAPRGSIRGSLAFGARVLEDIAAVTGIAGPVGGLYRMAEDALGLSVRLGSGSGRRLFAGLAANGTSGQAPVRSFGAAGWAPRAAATLTIVSPDSGSALELSAAPRLRRPLGWEGAGAFALSGNAYGVSWHRAIASGETFRLGFAGRLAQLETESVPLLRFDDATLAAVNLDLSLALGERTVLAAGLGLERAVRPVAGRLRLPRTIDESGTVGFDEIRLDGADFLHLDRGTLNLRHAPADGIALSTGVAVVRDGFGGSQAMAGLQAEVAF